MVSASSVSSVTYYYEICETAEMWISLPLSLRESGKLYLTSVSAYEVHFFSGTTRAIQKVKNVFAYSPRTCYVGADHWFLVFIVMLKSCLMHLYVKPCYVVSAEIAVAIIPFGLDLEQSDFSLFPKMEYLAGKRFAN